MDSATSPQIDIISGANLDAPKGFTVATGFDGRPAVQLNSAIGQFLTHLADDTFRFASDIGFTLAIRVKFDTAPTGQIIIEQGNPDSHGNDYNITVNQFNLFAFVDIETSPGNKNEYLSTIPLTAVAGTWYLFVIGYDPATDTVFASLNGAPKVSASPIGPTTSSGLLTEDFHVGTRQFFYASEFLDGEVDDLLIWKRVLTDAEIAQLGAGGVRGTYPFGYVLPSLTPATPQVCSATQCCDIDENYSSSNNQTCAQNFIPPTGPQTPPACTTSTVSIEPADGSSLSFPSYVVLTADVVGAVIHYTIDGATPTKDSPVYTDPFQITQPLTVKAIAVVGECDPITVSTATYLNPDGGFEFSYFCDTPDLVGQWGVFAPNGSADYHWGLNITFTSDIDITRIEIYQTDEHGTWNTGQAWATDEFVNPVEGPPHFHIFPLEVWELGAQINAAYATTFLHVLAGTHVYDLYGQPITPLFGFFKIKIFLGDNSVLQQIIHATCVPPPPPPPPPCDIPPAPTLVCDCTQITVTFAGTPGHNFQIYRAVLDPCGDSIFRLLTSGAIASNPQSFIDTNVTPGCTYCYTFSEQFPDPCGWKTSVQTCCTIQSVGQCDDSIMPASVQISGYVDGMFNRAANCFNCAENSGLPAWDGKLNHFSGNCRFATDVNAFKFEGVCILGQAQLDIVTRDGILQWQLDVNYSDGLESIQIWTGYKSCGTTPLGTYVRGTQVPFGCTVLTGPATITLV